MEISFRICFLLQAQHSDFVRPAQDSSLGQLMQVLQLKIKKQAILTLFGWQHTLAIWDEVLKC